MESTAPRRDEQTETWWGPLLTLARTQPGLTALLLMAIAGLGISIYLTIQHYAPNSVSLACATGGVVNCQSVTTSAYSVVPGTNIPITIPGMLFFLALGGLAGAGLRWAARGEDEDPRLRITTLLLTLVGLAFVIYLVFCEIVLVQRICEWCTVIHLLTLTSFLVALTRWQRRNELAVASPQVAPANHATPAHRHAPATNPSAGSAAHAVSRRTRHSRANHPPTKR